MGQALGIMEATHQCCGASLPQVNEGNVWFAGACCRLQARSAGGSLASNSTTYNLANNIGSTVARAPNAPLESMLESQTQPRELQPRQVTPRSGGGAENQPYWSRVYEKTSEGNLRVRKNNFSVFGRIGVGCMLLIPTTHLP